jgi:Tetratricopeptide repeat
MDLLQRALTARENTLGSEHPTVARTLCTLADSFEKLGAADKARALRERALAIFEHSPDGYLASVTKLRTLLGRASDA